jgi:hypothetical protein
MTRVRFLKPFVLAATVDMVTYNFNANPQTEGYIDDTLFDELEPLGLVVDLDA